MVMSTVRESGWSVPVAMAEEDMQSGTEEEDELDDAPPVHPVPTMQGAFEESMTETIDGDDGDIPDRYSKADSVTRRKMLLEQDHYERTVAGRWKQKPGEKFHPLWKLVAQISFGMHLLQQGLAKSDEEVLKILQTHVDEVDGFLERTTEDFDLAQGDINERIRYLKLPLEHGSVFDQMLADRAFRVAIVEGNEKIEHIIDRTAAAMNDALKDVQKGLDATRELAKYMTRVDKQWEDRTEEHDSVYLAMIGNTEGWTRAFLTLQSKGGHLRKALVQLGGIVAEMQKRAGAASRKNLVPSRSVQERYNVDTRSGSPQTQHPGTPPRSPMKPLPTAPDPATRVGGVSSDKYIRQQHDRSSNNSPYLGQSDAFEGRKLSTPNESMQRARSPNPVGPSRSPEPNRGFHSPDIGDEYQAQPNNGKGSNLGVPSRDLPPLRNIGSPEPPRNRSFDAPRPGRSPEPHKEMRSPEQSRNLKSPDLNRSTKTPSPLSELGANEARSKSPESSIPFRTPAQVMAQMNEASKPAIPQRGNSRRRSFMDGTKHLLRKKPSLQLDDEFANSGSNLPIQSPSADGSPAKNPSSPGSILRRLSSRKAHAMSMSYYSGSPTSTKFSTTPPRHDSPAHTRNGTRVPTQSSYGALLPTLEQISPFGASFPHNDIPDVPPMPKPPRTESPTQPLQMVNPAKPKVPPIAPLKSMTSVPDDSGGSVNTAHPLLREARHARLGSRTGASSGSSTPTGGELPFQGYQPTFAHSNPDLSQRSADSMIPHKQAGSLAHDDNNRNAPIPSDSAVDLDKRSPTPNQSTPIAPTMNMLSRAATVPQTPPAELGIHPAHRNPEPNPDFAPSSASPTHSNLSELAASGATPPPIATVRSPDTGKAAKGPPTRFPPQPPRLQTHNNPPETSSKPVSAATAREVSPHPGNPVRVTDRFPTTSPTAAPFYLNPASSTALVDFLSTSPPPSPPLAHPGTRTEPGTPVGEPSTPFFNRPYVPAARPGEASPPPPAPGSSRGGRSEPSPWSRDEGRAMTMQSSVPEGLVVTEQKVRKGSAGTLKTRFLKMREKVETGRLRDKDRKKQSEKTELGNGNGNTESPGRADSTDPDGGPGGTGGGFMGVGKDGNWISKKNFVKS